MYDREAAEDKLAGKLTGNYQDHFDRIAKAVGNGDMPVAALDSLSQANTSTLTASLTLTLADAVLALAVEHGVHMDYAHIMRDAGTWAKQYTYTLVKDIADTQKAQLQNVISQVADRQLTAEDATAMIEPLFGKARAQMIAATETTRAQSQAIAMYRKELDEHGIAVTERWLTAEDERVCEICGPLDHETEDVWRAQFPDGPPAHVNCRCQTAIEVVK
jgi:hypothetical protein